MNAFRTFLPALLALAPVLHAQRLTLPAAEQKFEEAVVHLREAAQKGRGVLEAAKELQVAQDVRNQLAEEVFPQACHARARLQLAMDELMDRARRTQLRQMEIEQYVEEAVQERLDEELSAIEERLAEGTMSPERFEAARQLIVRIANITLDQLHAQDVRLRLEAALDDLRNAAARRAETAQQMHRLRAILVQERVDSYLELIEMQVAAGRVHRIDYLLLQQRLLERTNFELGVPFDPCG